MARPSRYPRVAGSPAAKAQSRAALAATGLAVLRRIITTKGQLPGQGSGNAPPWSDGVQLAETSRALFVVGAGGLKAGTFSATFPSFAMTGTEATVPNAFTVKAAVEILGINYPLSFAGQAVGTVNGSVLETDILASHPDVPAGTKIWVRTFVAVDAQGKFYPWGRAFDFAPSANTGPEETFNGAASIVDATKNPASPWASGNSQHDNANYMLGANSGVVANSDTVAGVGQRTVGGAVNGLTGYGFAPSRIMGLPINAGTPAMVAYGDSITSGSTDSFEHGAGTRATGELGWVQKLFGQLGLPYFMATKAGAGFNGNGTAGNTKTVTPKTFASIEAARPHFILCELSINNLNAGEALAFVAGQNLGTKAVDTWTTFAAMNKGTPVYQTTATPNQNADFTTTKEANRVAWNTWLRDKAPIASATMLPVATGTTGAGIIRAGDTGHPLKGIVEVADLVETARNSGLWQTGYVGSSDKLHPIKAGHDAIRVGLAALDWTKAAAGLPLY